MHPAEVKYPQFRWMEQTFDYGNETALALEVRDEEGVVVRNAVRAFGDIHTVTLKPAVPLTDKSGNQLYRKVAGHYNDDEEYVEDSFKPMWYSPAKTRPATDQEVLRLRMSLAESAIDWVKEQERKAKRLVAALEGKLS